MSLHLYKFGGSSVGQADRLARVLQIVEEDRPALVVVSAMGDTTDWLLEAAAFAAKGGLVESHAVVERIADLAIRTAEAVAPGIAVRAMVDDTLAPLRELLRGVSLTSECSPATRDRILASGELISAQVITILLRHRGLDAHFLDARDWLVTDDAFGDARVDADATGERLRARFAARGVTVIPGFIGSTPDGRTTTLGRNGSDYTAAVAARALGAREITVWTDVQGLMTADPDLVDEAWSVPRLTHHEALELASVGARLFHPRTMIPLIEADIALTLRHTMEPTHPGTRIDAAGSPDGNRPTCIATRDRLALLGVEVRRLSQQLQVGDRVRQAVNGAGIQVWMATQSANGQSIALVVPGEDADRAAEAIRAALAAELERQEVEPVRIRRPVTLLSLVAEAMGRGVNVAGRLFRGLGDAGVGVWAIAQGASSRSISCVIDDADATLAVRTTHATFNLAHEQVSLLLLGKGTVGSQLLAQIDAQQGWLREHHGISLRLVGLLDSRGGLFREGGIAPAEAADALDSAGEPCDPLSLLDRIGRLPVPVLVDCTASAGMETLYAEAFRRGIHVVAANKKPLAIEWSQREALRAAARSHHVSWHYETTVGASLPVIDTLAQLVRTGDSVRQIAASLSGTLGFLSDELMAGVPLSQAVRVARERGFTEPHPAEDLSGRDVSRKALILAREMGLPLQLDDVAVEGFVPAELLDEPDLERFFAGLEAYDAVMAAKVAGLRAEGRVLRYLAQIDPAGSPVLRVGPVAVAADHPAAGLRGAEALVAFSTERHRDYPLTVRGAGAGGAVTASGVLADVLRIAQAARGR